MKDLLGIPVSLLVPGIVGLYALAFISGGIYYLEQRVARIRDQFPKRGMLSRLTAFAALGIGVLAAISAGGHLIRGTPEYRVGALLSVVAGVGFWVHRMRIDPTPFRRIRDGAFAFVCSALAVLTRWWVINP